MAHGNQPSLDYPLLARARVSIPGSISLDVDIIPSVQTKPFVSIL